jgi:excisionase family DNA binding protein
MIEFQGERFYEKKEVAQICAVHPRTAHGWILSGKMPAQKIGAKWYVKEETLKAFIKPDASVKTE